MFKLYNHYIFIIGSDNNQRKRGHQYHIKKNAATERLKKNSFSRCMLYRHNTAIGTDLNLVVWDDSLYVHHLHIPVLLLYFTNAKRSYSTSFYVVFVLITYFTVQTTLNRCCMEQCAGFTCVYTTDSSTQPIWLLRKGALHHYLFPALISYFTNANLTKHTSLFSLISLRRP